MIFQQEDEIVLCDFWDYVERHSGSTQSNCVCTICLGKITETNCLVHQKESTEPVTVCETGMANAIE